MSLAVTHRFNWMGYEGTESESLSVNLLRPGSDTGNMRNADLNYRGEVTSDIRLRLKLIKRDLGLLPPDDDKDSYIEEDISLDSDDEENDGVRSRTRRSENPNDPLSSTRGDMSKLAERRRKLLERGRFGDSDDDEEYTPVKLWPNPPSEEDVKAAASAIGPILRGTLSRRGEVYVSYLDGAEFLSLEELRTYNATARPRLEEHLAGSGVVFPGEMEFDTTNLCTLLESKNQCRMKLDAVRCMNDPSYASTLPAEELDNSGQPITNVNPDDGDEPALLVKLNAAKAELVGARTAYNKRAAAAARAILDVFVNYEKKPEEREEAPEEKEEIAAPESQLEGEKKDEEREEM